MALLFIAVNPSPNGPYEDGDIIEAFNNEKIRKHLRGAKKPEKDDLDLSENMLKKFLVLQVQDMPDKKQEELMEPIYTGEIDEDREPVISKARRHYVDWRSLGLNVSDVEDKRKAYDPRTTKHNYNGIVKSKS